MITPLEKYSFYIYIEGNYPQEATRQECKSGHNMSHGLLNITLHKGATHIDNKLQAQSVLIVPLNPVLSNENEVDDIILYLVYFIIREIFFSIQVFCVFCNC